MIQTKTQAGVDVALKIKNYSLFATFKHPKSGAKIRIKVSGWNTKVGEPEGVVGFASIDGKRARIVLRIPRTDWEPLNQKIITMKKNDIKAAMKLKIVSFIYKIGCDTSSEWVFNYEDNDLPFSAIEKRMEVDNILINTAKSLDIKTLGEKYEAECLDATIMSYGGYKFEGEALETLMKDIDEKIEKDKRKAAEKIIADQKFKAKREKERKEFSVEILEIDHKEGGEFGPDPYAKVRLADPNLKESAVFTCRNIFDVGYVINPQGGGIAIDVNNYVVNNSGLFRSDEEKNVFIDNHPTDTGWGWNCSNCDGKKTWIAMSEFEIRAVKYLKKFPPISYHVRM